MKIWTVVANYEEYHNVEVDEVLGYFSTLEKAREFRETATHRKLEMGSREWYGFHIYEHTLDEPAESRIVLDGTGK